MLSTLALAFTYIVLGSLAGVFGIPYSLLRGNVNLLYKVSMSIAALGVRVAGIRVETVGLEHVPVDRAVIFMSNHVSNLDPPVLLPRIPGHTSVLLKASLMQIPLLGTAMRMGRFVPVERGGSREAAKRSIAAAADVLRAGIHLTVFPEGTRSRTGHLAPFKKGPFYLASQTGAPIVPVAISGTERLLRKGSAALQAGTVRLQFLPVVESAEYGTREALMQAVHALIAAALPPELQPGISNGNSEKDRSRGL